MTLGHPQPRPSHANRRLAAALVVFGLVMQMLAPFLPMPAMGGATSWDLAQAALSGDLAGLPMCGAPEAGDPDRDSNRGGPHPGDCAACLVMQQAGSALAPVGPDLPLPFAADRVAPALWQQAQLAVSASGGFSSRAPPIGA